MDEGLFDWSCCFGQSKASRGYFSGSFCDDVGSFCGWFGGSDVREGIGSSLVDSKGNGNGGWSYGSECDMVEYGKVFSWKRTSQA